MQKLPLVAADAVCKPSGAERPSGRLFKHCASEAQHYNTFLHQHSLRGGFVHSSFRLLPTVEQNGSRRGEPGVPKLGELAKVAKQVLL